MDARVGQLGEQLGENARDLDRGHPAMTDDRLARLRVAPGLGGKCADRQFELVGSSRAVEEGEERHGKDKHNDA